MRRTIESKKAERLASNLHMVDFNQSNNHIYFVNSPSEIKNKSVSTNFTDAEINRQVEPENALQGGNKFSLSSG